MRDEGKTNFSAIGNDFIMPKTQLRPVLQTATATPVSLPLSIMPVEIPVPIKTHAAYKRSRKDNILDLIHEQSVIVFAILFMMVGIAIIEFGSHYIMAHDFPAPTNNYNKLAPAVGGLNKTVSNADLSSFINTLTSQPATLNLGSSTVSISPATIKSWLTITPDTATNQNYIHIDSDVVSASLNSLVNQYVVAPVSQVTITRGDGSSEVAIAGQNGTKLNPASDLAAQAVTIAKSLFSNKGINVNAPLVTLPFQAVTPSAFSKLIVVDLNSKRMYMYQSGNLINTILVSAGKPSTPTPVGEFHIWDKLTSQTMVGPGYVQPNVPWVNYFDHKGDAIHGVYWRPASVFGNINTSHGCVGVPVSTGEYIYNWAPIGTTVITTPN